MYMQYQTRQHTLFLEIIYFLEERGQVNDNTVSNQTCTGGVDEAWRTFLIRRTDGNVIARTTRKQMECKGCLLPIDVHDDGVPSVIAASATSTYIKV
jgi:hypothetical protein